VHPTCTATARSLHPALHPALDPALHPALDPALDPALHPALHPALDPALHPALHPSATGKGAAPRRPAVAAWSIKPALLLGDLAGADLVDGLEAVFVVPLLADFDEPVLLHQEA